MTFYIIITRSNGSELAASVYSSRKKAEAYISDTNMADSRIEPYEVPAGETFSTVMMYAAHKTNEGGASEVIGYYFNIYDAETAVNNNGFVERLPIDKVEEEIAEDSTESEEGFQSFKLEGRKAPTPKAQATVSDKLRNTVQSVQSTRYDWVLLAAVIILIIAGNIVYHVYYYNRFEFAENVPRVKWLPETAKNVSYYKDRQTDVYEFTISEDGFLKWSTAKRLDVKKIEGDPVKIPRYRFYADVPIEGLENMTEEEQYELWNSLTKTTINSGYVFETKSNENEKGNAGGYDSDTGRAYFRSI